MRPPKASEWTAEALILNRRALLGGAAAAIAAPGWARAAIGPDDPNTWEQITTYNNYVEFGPDKSDPSRLGGQLVMDPWSVEIAGLVDRPGSYALEDIAPENAREDRTYRFRCVEAWSMVIPWQGVPLKAVLDRAGVQPGAKFIAFESVTRPEQMPGQRARLLPFPYVEGLRIDEAMHPLTLLATGIWGRPLPASNGGPVRVVVPWKYGFKSGKSVVRITAQATQPATTWNIVQPEEYGFYANVNPAVDHPRWSQATERRIGAGLLGGRQETLPFNGYAEEVAGLYAGQDLARDY